jgi:ubiquinone/menaquinone biosynthesis C-methylase UbiE
VNFKDHFSKQAADYAKFRPQYPRALFEFIAAQAPNDKLALDLATGNGQAARGLAEFFQRVIALDASAKQIANAQPNDRVEYRVAPAEATELPAQSCAVLTVAQALHWFDLDQFYAEARRVLLFGGVIAIWTYAELQISPEVDRVVRHFYKNVVGPFWPPERTIVERGYRDLPFPFEEIKAPQFQIESEWSLDHLLGYLRTWSATQRFMAANGNDPVETVAHELAAAWNLNGARRAVWPLTTRIGRA